MNTIHFVLQGKGGVGKSLVASLLCQYLQKKGVSVLAVDTDPINRTLTGYKELNVHPIDIMNGDDIDNRRFDQLMEMILKAPEDNHMVIDNGAASFVPLCSYLKENDAFDLLCERNQRVFLHTILTGGQAMRDTVDGLKTLAFAFATTPLVVWLNNYFGDVVPRGESFEKLIVYKENIEKFKAIIQLPIRKQSTFGIDLEELFARRETFEAAINSNLPVMTRQRLKTYWRDVVTVIDAANILE